jgi:hypothetical protein
MVPEAAGRNIVNSCGALSILALLNCVQAVLQTGPRLMTPTSRREVRYRASGLVRWRIPESVASSVADEGDVVVICLILYGV